MLDCTYLTTVGNSSIVIVCIGPQAVEMPRLASKENMFVNMSLFGASEKKCIYIHIWKSCQERNYPKQVVKNKRNNSVHNTLNTECI